MEELNKTQRKDLLYVDPRSLILEEGFNTRTDYGDLDELKNSILENGVKIPLRGYKVRGEEQYIINDGHHNGLVPTMAIEEGYDIARVPFMSEDKKSMEERIFEILLSNDGKPLTSLELGETYKKLKNYGYNATEIAKRVGKSVTHVIDMIEVAGSTKEVKDSINEGTISATLVSEVKKNLEDKEDADEVISTVVQIRKEEGGTKVTKKDFTGLVKEKKKVEKEEKVEKIEEHIGTRTYSDKVTYTEKEVAKLLREQISKCAQQIIPAFRSKILHTPLVI